MATAQVFGKMLDNEGVGDAAETKFEVAKFDSDPWTKKNMAWDSDGNLGGPTTINAILDNAKDSKFLTVQVRNTQEMNSFYKILQKALNKTNHGKEGVFDHFTLDVIFDGIRRSVRFKNPIVKITTTAKENNVNFVIFTVTTKTEPFRS
jgi:hypothetical protein